MSSVIFSLPLQRPWVLPKESRCWEKGSSWAERAWSERIGRGFAGESGATLFPISCIQIVDSVMIFEAKSLLHGYKQRRAGPQG